MQTTYFTSLFQYLLGTENAFPRIQEDIDNQIVSGG